MEFRQIEIDVEVNKRIEAARISFSESENQILRRLLGVNVFDGKAASGGKPWSDYGVVLPHGTQLSMNYNGATYNGTIIDGAWFVEGQTFTSPSGAASGVARTKAGGRTNLDGWKYWSVKLPESSDWTTIWELWEKAQAAREG
jgi:hypothetical protein